MKIYSLKLLNVHVAMGGMASKFERAMDELLRKDAWILRGDGTVTTSHNVASVIVQTQKNQNKGVSSIWTVYGAIVVICIVGLV